MSELEDVIRQYELEIEEAEDVLERAGQFEEALAVYYNVEDKLNLLKPHRETEAFGSKQGVLAYCLLRQASVLKALGYDADAELVKEREIAAARSSGYDVTIASALIELAAQAFAAEEGEEGAAYLEDSLYLLEGGESPAHQQARGLYWLLMADAINAGLIDGNAHMVIDASSKAISTLLEVDAWMEISRAYGERAYAYEVLGDETAAVANRNAQSRYTELATQADNIGSSKTPPY